MKKKLNIERIHIALLALLAVLVMGATIVVKISSFPAVTTPASGDLFLLASGATNKNVSYGNLKSSINATNVNGSGLANTLPFWLTTNRLSFVPNGEGILVNDGSGSLLWTTNVGSVVSTQIFNTVITTNLTVLNNLSVSNITVTNVTIQNNLTVSNLYTVNGNHNTLIVTQYVRLPWTTLTMSGSNVSAMNFAAASMFKLTLTNDGFLVAPSNLPGTNTAQTIQLFVAQDGTGGRGLTCTNGSWIIAGSGTSSNAVVSLTTNANAVTVLTFTTSPYSSTKVYGVVAAMSP